jgi:hypothetical protein
MSIFAKQNTLAYLTLVLLLVQGACIEKLLIVVINTTVL